MKYVIQMQDGSYYMEPGYAVVPGVVMTTSKLTEAKLFDTRWDALIVQGQGVKFSGTKIQSFSGLAVESDG